MTDMQFSCCFVDALSPCCVWAVGGGRRVVVVGSPFAGVFLRLKTDLSRYPAAKIRFNRHVIVSTARLGAVSVRCTAVNRNGEFLSIYGRHVRKVPGETVP